MGILILLGSFVLLLLVRVPIALTLVISSVLTGLYMHIDISALVQRMVSGVKSFSLLAFPFFIIAGEIMTGGGI